MKRSLVVLVLFTSLLQQLLAAETHHYPQYDIIAPFGFPGRQPPPVTVVKIVDARIGLEAKQVCGYTDWTTTQLHLPTELLSKTYWKHVGKHIMEAASQVVMNLTGAIPSMLACNVSPTFCSVFNQAEMMAAFEASLTFDTCEVLNGIADNENLQATSLRTCVQKYTTLPTDPLSSSAAREKCLNDDLNPNGLSKKQKIDKTAELAASDEKPFNFDEFLDDLFPGKVKTDSGVQEFNRDGHTYSRRKKSKDFTKTFLKGITLRGNAMYEVGGTFQGTLEKEKDFEQQKIKNAILVIIQEMREYQKKGYADRDVIKKSEHLWVDKNKWKQDQEPHPIYRPSGSDAEPTFLISPEQILMLTSLADDSKPQLLSDELRQAIDRLASSASNVKLTDKLIDTHRETIRVCQTNPKYQDAISKKNCDTLLKETSSNLQFLQYQNTVEAEAFKAQQEVRAYVQNVNNEKANSIHKNSGPRGDFYAPNFFEPGK